MLRKFLFGVAVCWSMLAVTQMGWTAEAHHHHEKARAGKKVPPVVKELKAIHELLLRADSDYKGHRMNAAKEIRAAMEILDPKLKSKPVKVVKTQSPSAKPSKKALKEAQAVSDAQIRQARGMLVNLLGHAQGANPAVVGKLSNAVAEIDNALAVHNTPMKPAERATRTHTKPTVHKM